MSHHRFEPPLSSITNRWSCWSRCRPSLAEVALICPPLVFSLTKQASATKAAAKVQFDSLALSSSESSSSLTEDVSEPEDLGEIIEFPNIDESFDSPESRNYSFVMEEELAVDLVV